MCDDNAKDEIDREPNFEIFKNEIITLCEKYPASEEFQKFKKVVESLSSFDDLNKL